MTLGLTLMPNVTNVIIAFLTMLLLLNLYLILPNTITFSPGNIIIYHCITLSLYIIIIIIIIIIT